MEDLDAERLYELFHPFAVQRVNGIRENNTRFVHYTNAEAAMSIIRNQEIWMRRVTCMSDYLEVMHGQGCLSHAFDGQAGKDFWEIFDDVSVDLKTEVSKLFEGWLPSFSTETYITCVSEHRDKEDIIGRLSMWRGYSGRQGVALVLKNDVFLSSGNTVGLASSPVEYLDENDFSAHLSDIVLNIKK